MIKHTIQTLLALVVISIITHSCGTTEGRTPPKRAVIEANLNIPKYDFIDIKADTIIDPWGTMRHFYECLQQVSEVANEIGTTQVSIAHFGDSHIQAGEISRIFRHRMQARFGNAGRGFIAPLRLSGSNEPQDYRITTPNSYTKARLLDKSPATNIGIGGVGIKSDDMQQQFHIAELRNPRDTVDYTFNRVVVFHDPLSPIIVANEKLVDSDESSPFDFTTVISLLEPTDTLMLYTYRRDKYVDGSFHGFSLENGRNGVLCHSMGINGACFLHWGRNEHIARHTQALDPTLIIVSLGANEASGRNFIEEVFYKQIDSFISRLRVENPAAVILLTTQPETMRKQKRTTTPNPNFEKIRNTILKYGADKRVAVLDIYQATGGAGSSKKWVENKLMQRDLIHYTAQGYEIQGTLIYAAILDGYRKMQ